MNCSIYTFRRGLRDGLPICVGYFPVAFAFAIFAVSQGLTGWEVILISMTNVTSAGQLAAVPLFISAAPLYEMAATQLVINLRYALMSVSLSQKLDGTVRLRDRFLIAFVNTDEVFAVSSAQEGEVGRGYLYGLILTPYLGWSAGTAVGVLAGSILPAILVSALGIAIYGMFFSILLPAARADRGILAAELIAASMSCVIFFVPAFKSISGGFSIILCAVVSAALLAVLRPMKTDGGSGEGGAA